MAGWCGFCSDRATPRRSRLPQAWRHSRRHLEAGRQQGRPSPQSQIAAVGARPGRQGPGAGSCVRWRRRRQARRLLQAQARARPGSQGFRLAPARSAAHRSHAHAGARRAQRDRAGGVNHAIPGVGGVYLRAELEAQKAEALKPWAAALGRIVKPRAKPRSKSGMRRCGWWRHERGGGSETRER